MNLLTSIKILISHLTHSQLQFHSSTLLIELFSSFQILSSIILTVSLSSSPSHTLIKSLHKNLSLLTATFQTSQPSIYIQPLWFLSIIYLLFHLFLLFYGLIPIFHNQKPCPKLTQMLNSLYLLHSRIIFFPIQSLLLNHAHFYQQSFYSHFGWLVGTLLLLGLNFSLAFFKEFVVYRLNQTQNHYDAKTNLYHQASLIYKTLALGLCYFAQQDNVNLNKISALVHLFASILLLLVLYIKLPFYSFKMLKMTIIMSAIIFCLSLICVMFVLSGHNHQIQGAMQILIPFLPILGVKLALLQFRALFINILKLKFRFPEHAIHFALLLEDLALDPEGSSIQCNKGLFPSLETVVGVITGQNIDLSKLKEDDQEREKLSLFIMGVLEKTKFPSKSKILLIYMAQFYLEKLDNIPKALDSARKLENNNKDGLLFFIKRSLEYIYKALEENNKENQNHLELSKYFKFYELTNKIKKEILTETNKHIEMWKDMTKQEWEINKIRAQAEEIDSFSHKIRKEINLHKDEFKRNFNTPMLLYAIYLNNIREMRHEAGQILVTCQASIETQKVSNEYDNISGTKAIVIISLEKNKVGQILDASGSLHNLFNFRKAEIIGKRFGCLFPGFIAQKYQKIIQQYAKTPVYKFDLNEETLGKGSNDEIFKLQVSFQLHPYMNKEITIMIQLQKLSDSLPVLIANHEGTITEYSSALKTTFHKEEAINLTILKSIQCLSPVMESTNTAFNIHYGDSKNSSSKSPLQQPQQQSSDRLAQSSLYTAIEEDTIAAVHNSSRSLIRVTELSDRVKAYPRGSPGIQMTQKTAEQTCQKFIEGRKLLITPVNPSPLYKKYRLKANFQITPHLLENNVYKVITVTGLARKSTTFKEENFIDSSDNASIDTLADDFPYTSEGPHSDVPIFKKEKTDSSAYSSAELLYLPVQRVPFQRKKENRETTFVNSTNKALKKKDSQSDVNTQLNKMQHKIKELRKQLDKNNLYSTYQENKNTQAIKDITTNKKIYPVLNFLQFLLYTCFISLILLAGIEFNLAQSSIKEIQAEVNLINTATLRLQAALSVWQWSLSIFASSPIPLFASFAIIKESALNLTIYNSQLKAQLSTIHNRDLIDRAFVKDITMVELPVNGDDNVNVVDTFTATDIFVNQYLVIAEQDNLNQIRQIPTIVLTLNNTANDYLSSSRNFKDDIDLALQKQISNDILVLNSVLISEIFVFMALGTLLIIMAGIVYKAYKKLFTALKRTQDIHILQRLDHLKKTQQFFEDDIERKSFLQDSFALFIQEPSLIKTPKKSTAQNKSKTLSTKMIKRHMLKTIGFALISIPALIGLCIVALQRSISLFHSLSNINDHVSLLSSACYQSNGVLSNLIFAILAKNTPGALLNNLPPFEEANRTLNQFNRLNEKLIGTFLQGETVDPMIQNILQENVCGYLDPYGKSACYNATNGQELGLLGVNIEYYNVLKGVIVAIEAGASSSYIGALISSSLIKLSGERVALGRIYLVMIDHIMEEFDAMTQKSLDEEIVYFVIILLVIVGYGGFVCGKCLEGLKRMDLGRRNVLKVIPYEVMQENKAFIFYLVKNFGKEARDLRNSF